MPTQTPARQPKFQIVRSADQVYFRFRAANGEIVFSSERLTTKQTAKRTIEMLKRSVASAPVEDLTLAAKKTTKRG